MFSIAICEDEREQTLQLVDVLNRYESTHSTRLQISTFESAEQFINSLQRCYDLVFLDIGLPGMDGVELAREIRARSKRTKIVFLTAHEQYWPEGYKVMASQFLVKPISSRKLYEEIERLLDMPCIRKQYILATKDKHIAKVPISEILYLEISGRKVLIHTEQETFQSSHNLSYWMKELADYPFVQTHSSYLVHLKYVKLVGKDHVTLTNNQQVYMSIRKYKPFKDSFMRYVSQL